MDQKNESDKSRAHEMECIRRRLFADAFLDTLRRQLPPNPELPVTIANAALAGFDKAFPKAE